ncbi:PAS-domain containing protein [Puniceibacterium sp. IMCC21224]|uniref:PAS-domain containing protein n=1 Tax=Puniceibacterium sp. IMCC21224 TaxID=1618204 RepID=UPI00065DB104|nr:PAS-domain containing protein [Puniceibacterium sp. IMCC21224]KMK65288.1 PAS fold [Puniceibacterium sp. IMCC21224]
MQTYLILSAGLGACLSAIIGVLLLRSSLRPERPVRARDSGVADVDFLIRDGFVFNATTAAWRMIGQPVGQEFKWACLYNILSSRFPNLTPEPPQTPQQFAAIDNPDTILQLTPEAGDFRISLRGRDPTLADIHKLAIEHTEFELLRTAMAALPNPVWQCNSAGRVLWSNAAYVDFARRMIPDDPQGNLFDLTLPPDAMPQKTRANVGGSTQDKRYWFEVTSIKSSDTWLNYAVDIDAIVNAETAQRNFVQTLAKTFAHLPIGLAIFDRDRRLALFNPALIDLTALPADFLSGRPNLLSFFDHMRENRMIPEPKNYVGWREQMASLVAAATDDRYSETWTLPSGLTYKITGRPHPDGAVAFLLEDISAEISLTRRFRSELELNQSVIEVFDDAVAVFSPLGVLTFCNDAYRDMWKTDPDSAFAAMTILDAIRLWQGACVPTPVWQKIRDMVLSLSDRNQWSTNVKRTNGEHLLCRLDSVSGGATVVRFTAQPADADQRIEQASSADLIGHLDDRT